jgi:succinate dehydrogenase/fumarate reductase flavoprotein subunit
MSGMGIDRRGFLRGVLTAGVAGAALGILSGCGPSSNASGAGQGPGVEPNWDEETDVVVVGYGGAGACAAIEAQSAGARVIVFEKGNFAGGSTAICGQAIFGVNSKLQKEMGIEDSVEEALAYFKCVGDGKEDMWRMLLEKSGEAVDWLMDRGMEVPAVEAMPGLTLGGQETLYADVTPPIPRTHWSTGLWSILQSGVQDAGVEIRLETPVTALITDPATNTVIGVKARNGSRETYVKANRGVILAAGGFSRNPEMKLNFVSQYEILSIAGNWDDGDGLKLGASVGADIGYFGLMNSPDYTDPVTKCTFLLSGSTPMVGAPPYIAINEQGQRFSNERKFYSYIADDILTQKGGHAWVFTAGPHGLDGLADQQTNIPLPIDNTITGETPEDVARALGADPDALLATIAEWNTACANGGDGAFGRTEDMYPFTEGPYYAAEVKCGDGSTFGGVTVNKDSQALNILTGEPIPHLYAAGANSAALGRFYPSCGAAIMTVVVTGRTAGAHAAAN